MNPSTQNSKAQITTIELENEVKSIKSEKESVPSPVKMDENPKGVDNTKEIVLNIASQHQQNLDATRPANKKTRVKKVHQDARGVDKAGMFSSDYWVQAGNVSGRGGRGPEDSVPNYEPGRNKFVLKVFIIVTVMLLVTALSGAFVYYDDELRAQYKSYGIIPLIIGFVGVLCVYLGFFCTQCARRSPWNWILLILGVIFMTEIVVYVTIRYSTDILFLALLSTMAVVTFCMILACTSFDFTRFLLFVIGISVAVAAIGLCVTITSLVSGARLTPLRLIILIVGTILNVVILIMQLQMILGGKTVELNEQDYALGAFMLYMSIVQIFLSLVKILGIVSD